MESGALCLGCNWRKDSPARRIESAFMRAYRIREARRILLESDTFYRAAASMGSDTLCLGCNLHEGGPARFHAPPYGGGSYGKSVRPIMSGGFYGEWCILQGEVVLYGKESEDFFRQNSE